MLSKRVWSRFDFEAWIVASALSIIAIGDGESGMTLYLSSKVLMKWSLIPQKYSGAFVLTLTLDHCIFGQSWCIWNHPSQPEALTRCPWVVTFILFHHLRKRLFGLQYDHSASSLVSHLVNIPVSAFRRGLQMIPLFNPNLGSFSDDYRHSAQSFCLCSYLNGLSRFDCVSVACNAISVTVDRNAIRQTI